MYMFIITKNLNRCMKIKNLNIYLPFRKTSRVLCY